MGQCAYRVNTLETNGVQVLDPITLEPYPIVDYPDFELNLQHQDWYHVYPNQSVRFQCYDPNQVLFDADTNEPILLDGDEEGGMSLTNYFVHTCLDLSVLESNYTCYNAPTTTPTSSSSPTTSTPPTTTPSTQPTIQPTISSQPTQIPTSNPSSQPTTSSSPTNQPTPNPSSIPTISSSPTKLPSSNPTIAPSSIPTVTPSYAPTSNPTSIPSTIPTTSVAPSLRPSSIPSMSPSQQSMANEVAITRLQRDVTTLNDIQSASKEELIAEIVNLNTRLDSLAKQVEHLVAQQVQTQLEVQSNTESISSLRGYTDTKNENTRYWVTRAWVYATGGRAGLPQFN